MYLVFITNFLVIQSIHSANHGVRWYHVGAGVGDDIRGCHMRDVLELMENVKTFQYDEQAVVEEGASQSGIAYPVGGVQLLRCVVLALVHHEVGGKVELPRQLELPQQTAGPVDRFGDGTIVVGIGQLETGAQCQGLLLGDEPFQAQVIIHRIDISLFLHGISLGLIKAHLVVHTALQIVVQIERGTVVQRRAVGQGGSGGAVAIHIIITVELSTCRLIIRSAGYDGIAHHALLEHHAELMSGVKT